MLKEIEFQFKSPNDSPGYLLGQLTTLWQRKLKKVLDPLNLTQTQFVLLAALGWLLKKNDVVTQVEIAIQSNADRMMVSKVLRTLEEKKFIGIPDTIYKATMDQTFNNVKIELPRSLGQEIANIASLNYSIYNETNERSIEDSEATGSGRGI